MGPRVPLQISVANLEASSIKLTSSGPSQRLPYTETQSQTHSWLHFSLWTGAQSTGVQSLSPGHIVQLKSLKLSTCTLVIYIIPFFMNRLPVIQMLIWPWVLNWSQNSNSISCTTKSNLSWFPEEYLIACLSQEGHQLQIYQNNLISKYLKYCQQEQLHPCGHLTQCNHRLFLIIIVVIVSS